MKILGAIIAGGKSSRMGQDKTLMLFRGKPLIAHVAERLAAQTDGLVINANGDPSRFAFLDVPMLPDVLDTGTPVSGLHAVLAHASEHGFEAVLTSPCDTPLLPPDLRAKLAGEGAAVAASGGQTHYLTGFWPTSLTPQLKEAIQAGIFRVKDWAAACDARVVEWTGEDPFINLNTPEDLLPLSEKP
jgi:molybdenum cofactor guanylyltransferase